MRAVTVYKKIPFSYTEAFPLCVFDVVSNNTFMRSNKKWSMIGDIKHPRLYEYCIVLIPLSNFRLLRFFQKIWIIATYPV